MMSEIFKIMENNRLNIVTKLLLCTSVVLVSNSAMAQENGKMKEWVKDNLREYNSFYYWSTPRHLYSVGAFFERSNKKLGERYVYFTPKNSIGEGTLPENKPKYEKLLYKISDDFASTISLDDTTAKTFSAALGVGGLFKILGINVTAKDAPNVHTKITGGSIQVRQMELEGYKAVMRQGRLDKSLKNLIEGLDFGVMQSDIIISDLTVEVETTNDSKFKVDLDAKFPNGITVIPGLENTNKSTTIYKFASKSPIVLATQPIYPNKNNRLWQNFAAETNAIPDPRYAYDLKAAAAARAAVNKQ